jgi:gliding motility-associated-like protein
LTLTLTVNPLPTYSLAANSYTICNGASQTFSVSGASTYTWTPAVSLTGANTANPTAHPTTTTVYSVTGTNANACTNLIPATVTVSVNPLPTYSLTSGSYTICNGSSQTFSVSGATTYTWTPAINLTGINTANPTANPTTTTVYSVTGTNAGGCTNLIPATITLTINSVPDVSVVASSTAICSGAGSSTLTASGASSYVWTSAATLSSGTGSGVTATPTNTATPTVYTVTGTNVNGCTNKATVSITVNQTPTVTVSGGGGNAQIICGGGLVNTSVTGITFVSTPAGNISWSNSNINLGGPLSSVSGIGNIASYPAPSVSVQTVGTVTASAIASGSGCPSTNNTQLIYTITINPIPGAATPTITPASCGVNDGTIIGANGTGGSTYQYSWDGGATFSSVSSYTNGAGTYPLEIKDVVTGCIFSKNFTLPNAGAPAPPTVTASSSSVCIGGTATLTVNAPIAGTTYSWTPSTGTPGTGNTFTVTIPNGSLNPFTVDVTSTAANCTGVAATTSIAVNQLPTPSISNSTSQICNLTSTTLTVTPNTGGYSYQWGNAGGAIVGAPKDTLTVSAAGVYSVTVTNTVTGCQASTSNNGTITVNPLPIIDVTDVNSTPSNCNSPTGTITNITYTVNGTGTYVWTDNATGNVVGGNTPTLSNVPAGNYCVQITDANTCVKKFCSIPVINAGAPAQPVLTASLQDTIYCNGTGPKTLTVTVANSGTVTPTVNWYDASNAILISNSNTYTPVSLPVGTTTLYVTATANGCSSTGKPVTITINPLPTYTLTGNSYTVCAGGSQTLTISGTGINTYTWSPAATLTGVNTANPTASPTATTVYSVTGTDANGCSNNTPATASVNVIASPNLVLSAGSYSICTGSSQTLSASGVSTYTWLPATNLTGANTATPVANPTTTTVYTVTGTSNGCAPSAPLTLTLTVNSLPVINLAADSYTICSGNSQTFTVSGANTFTWAPATDLVGINSATPTANPTTSTVYSVTGTDLNGCTGLMPATVTLTVNQPPVLVLSADSYSVCSGNTQAFSATGANTYTWTPSTTLTGANTANPTANATATTVYTVNGSNNGCLSGSPQTVTLTVDPNPSVNISNQVLDTAKCGHLTGGVTGVTVVGGTPNFSYQWYNANGAVPGETSLTLSNVAAGLYTLQVTDANGCTTNLASSATSFSVPASASVHAQFSTNPSSATGDIPLVVNFTNTSTTTNGALTYIWNFGDPAATFSTTVNANFTYTQAGSYTATLVAENGLCKDTARVVIVAETPTTIVIPNIFSPNGDGINDEFFIKSTGLISLTCDIFNRWGQLLHTLTAPDQSWDGITPNGDKAPEGTYMYIFQAMDSTGKEYKQQGTLMLVR